MSPSRRRTGAAAIAALALSAPAAPAAAAPPNPSWTCSAHAATVNVGGSSGGTLDPLHANTGPDAPCRDDGATVPAAAAKDVLGEETVTLTSGNLQAQTGITNGDGPTYRQAPAAAAQLTDTRVNVGGQEGLTVTLRAARSYVYGQCRGTTPFLGTPDGPEGGQVVDLRINGTAVPAEGQPDEGFTQLFEGLSPLAPIVRVSVNQTHSGMDPVTGSAFFRREAVRVELLTAPDAAPLATIVLGSATVDRHGDVCAAPAGVTPPGSDGEPLVDPPPLLSGSNQPGSTGGGGGAAAGSGASSGAAPDNGRNASRCARMRMYFDLQRRSKPRTSGPTRITTRRGIRRVARGTIRNCQGRAIVAARIDVIHILKGRRRLVKTGLRSRAGGALTIILPNNLTTRTIEFAYRPFRQGTAVAARRNLRIRVVRRR